MPSFDIVSEVDSAEILNATNNAIKVLDTRFDFRGANASFSTKDGIVTMKAEADFHLQQMLDILRTAAVKRKIDPSCMDTESVVHTGKTYSQAVTFQQGVEVDVAKKIVKAIKDQKMKVQASIQGDQVRITGKKRDDLQAVMTLVREGNFGQPFQFDNFRD
ncbi:MAG: hypothetical protein ACI9FJ_001555 [Alteromonadaceae bacterium]|jgi:uncharacterized protein YajQ (UPF0234 family)